MNQFTEVYHHKTRSRPVHPGQHEWQVAARIAGSQNRLRQRLGSLLAAGLAMLAVAYCLATASLTAILVSVGGLSAVVGLVIAFGLYVLDNVA